MVRNTTQEDKSIELLDQRTSENANQHNHKLHNQREMYIDHCGVSLERVENQAVISPSTTGETMKKGKRMFIWYYCYILNDKS